MRHVAPALLLFAALSVTPTKQAGVTPADLALLDGRILTVDRQFSTATAVAVANGRFVAVGADDEIRRHIGAGTRVIQGRGRTVIPGIIDTHVHALDVAAAEAVQPFRSLASVREVQDWIRNEAARRGPGTWIWTPRTYPTRLREHRFPTRSELDAATTTHPVVVDCAYAFALNSAALAAAGITRDTPAQPGGAIVKDATGEPTGVLRNAGSLLARFGYKTGAPPLDALEQVHRQYLATGITSIIERGATVEGHHAYQALHAAGRLRVRSTVTVRVPDPGDPAAVARFVDGLPASFGQGDEWLKAGPLKLVADGGILIGTSFMRAPFGAGARELYALDSPADRGLLSITPEQITNAVAIIHQRGRQVVVHVTGDAGVDAVLDAIEAAQNQYPGPDRRHTLIHAYFVHPEVAARAARLGVLVDTQPAWYYKDADALASGLGRGRLARFIGLHTWRAAGVSVAINTDHMLGLDRDEALNPFNPFLTIYTATTRKTASGQVVSGDEAVSREDALRMMTSAAARLSFDEKDRGSIEVGKLGDFVILDGDVMTMPAERLRTLQPLMTVVGGRVVFERPATQ